MLNRRLAMEQINIKDLALIDRFSMKAVSNGKC
jgi:hypothetical protein